jgi:carboxymethylenebutenolidase
MVMRQTPRCAFRECRGGITIRPAPLIESASMVRFALLLVLGLTTGGGAAAQTELPAQTTDGLVAVKVYAARGDAPRPTVLILHGLGGTNPTPGYVSLADSIAASGMDAWLFTYYTPADQTIMFASGRDAHLAVYTARMPIWAKKVDEIADFSLTQQHSSGKVGLLGLSNGGFLAVGAAALDPRIAAIVVFYGGIPGPLRDQITRLPPLLALHGTGDTIIPIAEDRALVDRAKTLGGEAELIVYPGAGHGFDFDEGYDMAREARGRAITFLSDHLR